ncbi:MAG: pantoate--beta-alanine ligase [Pseudomonadota bacterium]
MKVLKSLAEWRALRVTLRDRLGFVPTMGALHAGHASLIDASVRDNELTALSIYVNPTQFNNAEDLASYPDTLEADLELARHRGVDFVLLPSYDELYADDYRYGVIERELSGTLCGAHRPGHFDGVLTVVLKLLNIVQPTNAYFGEKDYQQYELIRDMADAFFLPTTIVPCPTVREADGLALSSRNLRLTATDRARAPAFPAVLRSAPTDTDARRQLEQLGFVVDYIVTRNERRYGAATLGSAANEVRLIDNVPVSGPLVQAQPNAPSYAEAS